MIKEREHASDIFSTPAHSWSGKGTPNEAETIGNVLDPALAEISQRYQVLAVAGQGGMGIVYRARDCETGEQLALKVRNQADTTRHAGSHAAFLMRRSEDAIFL